MSDQQFDWDKFIEWLSSLRHWMSKEEMDLREKAAAEIAALRARLAVVEGALSQYADPENWSCSDDEHDHINGHCCLDVWDATTNGYEVAQAALANTLPELLAKVEAEHER